MPTRTTYLGATLNGTPLVGILSASCTHSWKANGGVPTATIFVTVDPAPGTPLYDYELVLTMGAGAHNLVRFKGLFRHYDYSLFPRAIGLVFVGYLTVAAEYQNHDNPTWRGGLLMQDFAGSATPTDADVVTAVLALASVSHPGANTINGTGVTWGSRSVNNLLSYAWRAGTGTDPRIPLAGAGQTALEYIQSWDKVSAVYTDSSSPAGFYRTYETPNGIYRALIGGRPRSTADLTLSEGIDLEPVSKAGRDYPLANAAFVTGADFGLGIGPVRNVADGGNFLGQSSNPYQSAGKSVTYDFGSPFIEWSTEAEAGIGMNCERVGNALLADLNRETVTLRFRTPLDDYLMPGMVIAIGTPGSVPDRLGIGLGDPLWVDEVTCGVGMDAAFYQEGTCTGGGTDTDFPTPAPPT